VDSGAQLIALDVRSLEASRLIKDFKPDVVFHLAAQINLRRSLQQPLEDASINILGSINVMQSLVESAEDISKVKFVFSSTGGAIYGDVDILPTPETVEPNPLSPYGVAKFSVEKYLIITMWCMVCPTWPSVTAMCMDLGKVRRVKLA